MNNSINQWWLMPLVTLIIGIVLALMLHEPRSGQSIEAITPPAVQQPPVNKLQVTQVALPPAPVAYEPKLTAKVENNRVVVEQEQFVQPVSSEPVNVEQPQLSIDNDDALSAGQSKLAQQLNQVMKEMADEEAQPQQAVKLHAQALTLYPQWYQDLVPPLEFSSHIYASNADDRWVRVNNQVVKEGELINASMRLVKVEPQQVVIEMQQRRFTLPSLSSW